MLETECQNRLSICMRDDTFELSVPSSNRRWRVNIEDGSVDLIHDPWTKDEDNQLLTEIDTMITVIARNHKRAYGDITHRVNYLRDWS